MATPIVSVEGRSGLMASLLKGIIGGANGCKIALYVNNLYPTAANVIADFTLPGPLVLPALNLPTFTDTGITLGFVDIWDSLPFTFTAGVAGAGTLAYGYVVYFTNPFSLLVQSLWFERFAAPYLFPLVGSTLTFSLTPGFTQG